MIKVRSHYMAILTLFFVFALSGCATESGGGAPINELKIKANQGDRAAQYQLGLAYDLGRGVSKNQNEAASWYRKAAEQNEAAAQNSLGSMFQYGEGVAQDNAEAVRWYQKAADQGYGEAYTNLGYMYDGGLGVKPDHAIAVKLYQNGVEKGSLNAMLNLGVSFWRGEGTPKDLVQAYKWLDLARFYTQNSSNMKLKWRVRSVLDQVRKEMTKDQIAIAEKLTREWDAMHHTR